MQRPLWTKYDRCKFVCFKYLVCIIVKYVKYFTRVIKMNLLSIFKHTSFTNTKHYNFNLNISMEMLRWVWESSWRRQLNVKFTMTNHIIIQQKEGIYQTLECPNINIQIYTSNLLKRISFYNLFKQHASLAFNSSCMRKQKWLY